MSNQQTEHYLETVHQYAEELGIDTSKYHDIEGLKRAISKKEEDINGKIDEKRL